MALKITNAKDVKEVPVTALLYAKPGTGKTTTLGMLKGRTVVVDVDNTSGVLKGKEHVTIIGIDTDDIFNQLNEVLAWLRDNRKAYDNVAIDNISSLQRAMLSKYGEAGKNDGVPSQGDYQKYQFKLLNIIRWLKGLKKNVILTAWEDIDNVTQPTGEQYSMFMPQINKRIRDEICGECNMVGHIEILEDGSRGIRLATTKNIYAKNQVDARTGCKPETLLGGK